MQYCSPAAGVGGTSPLTSKLSDSPGRRYALNERIIFRASATRLRAKKMPQMANRTIQASGRR